MVSPAPRRPLLRRTLSLLVLPLVLLSPGAAQAESILHITLVAIAINGSHHNFNVAMMSVDGDAHEARSSTSHCA